MVLELLDVAAFLTASAHLVAAGVIQQPYVLSPLYETVKTIGQDGVLELIGRQAEALPQFRRDERDRLILPREHTLVAGQDHHIAEIQCPGLERSHHLKSLEGLSLERHAFGTDQLLDKTDIGLGAYRHIQVLEQGHAGMAAPREFGFHRK